MWREGCTLKKWIVFMLIGAILINLGVFSMPVIWIQSDFTLFKLGLFSFLFFAMTGTCIGMYSVYLFCKEQEVSR